MRRIALSGTQIYAICNYLYFFLLLAMNFATTPILLAGLGPIFFGIWKAILRLLDFATVADARPTQALKWTVARNSQNGDDDIRRRAIGSAIAVWIIWTPVLLLLLTTLVWAVPYMMTDLSPGQLAAARLSVGILGLNVILGGLLGIPDAVLIGSGQGYRSINITTAFVLINSAALAFAAFHGLGLATLAMLTVATTTLNALLTWRTARRHIQWWAALKPDPSEVSHFSRLSGWNLLWSVVNQLMLSSELFLFARLIGAEGVTQYSVTAYASQAAQMICMFTVSAIIPRLASLLGSQRLMDAAVVARQSREIVLALAMVAGCATLLFNRSFVSLWVGGEHYLGSSLNAWIVIAFFQLAAIRCDGQILDATMDVRDRAIYGLAASVLAIGGALLVFHFTNSIEACYFALIGARFIQSVSYALNVRNQISGAGYPWRGILTALTAMGLCFFAGEHIAPSNWITLLCTAALWTAPLIAVAAFGILSNDTLERIAPFIGKIRKGAV